MPKRILLLVGLAMVATELGSPARGSAAEAQMYFSRRGPTTEGCLGPTVGGVPQFVMAFGRMPTLHIWLNVDGLPANDTFSELGWGVEYTSINTYATAPLVGSDIANPLNPASGQMRWDATLGEPAPTSFMIYRAGGVSQTSPSIGTTAAAQLDPGYDAASNSFYLGSITTYVEDLHHYYLRNGGRTALKSGEPIDLLFGDSDLAHSGATPDDGDPLTAGYADAQVYSTLRQVILGIYAFPADANPPHAIERHIDLAAGRGNAAYCSLGEWYSKVAVDSYHRDQLEIYVDFAGVSGADFFERLPMIPPSEMDIESIVDVSGTYPLHNGIDYDVRIRYAGPPPGESFVLSFDTEFDYPGYPIANIGIVPEPSSVALAAIGVAAAALAYRRRAVCPHSSPGQRERPPFDAASH